MRARVMDIRVGNEVEGTHFVSEMQKYIGHVYGFVSTRRPNWYAFKDVRDSFWFHKDWLQPVTQATVRFIPTGTSVRGIYFDGEMVKFLGGTYDFVPSRYDKDSYEIVGESPALVFPKEWLCIHWENSSKNKAKVYLVAVVRNVHVGTRMGNLVFCGGMTHMIGDIYEFKKLDKGGSLWQSLNGWTFPSAWLDFDYNKKTTRVRR